MLSVNLKAYQLTEQDLEMPCDGLKVCYLTVNVDCEGTGGDQDCTE